MLSNISIEALLGVSVPFLAVAIYWRETGHLAFIGWIVRILWIPINVLFVAIWILACTVNFFIYFVRNITFLKVLVYLALIGAGYVSYQVAPIFIPLLLWAFYIIWVGGINTAAVKGYIFFSPQAKRQPQKKIKAPKPPKPSEAAKVLTKKEKQKKAEADIPPLVEIAPPIKRGFENEKEIIGQLAPHLQELINKKT